MDDEYPPEVVPDHKGHSETPESGKARRRTLMRRFLVGGIFILLVPVIVHVTRHWFPKIWDNLHFVNFIVAAIPTVLSILFAFIIDKDLESHMRFRWRLSIVGVGMLYSLFLWHQQDLTDKANADQTDKAISTAVERANAHSDQKFGEIQGRVDGLGNKVDKQSENFVSQIGKTETDLATSIGKVGKPDPPERPKLTFSLWKDELRGEDFPLEEDAISPDANGNYQVRFAIRNESSVVAQGIEIWVRVCDLCTFGTEPKEFESFKGMDVRERHRSIPALNPGVTLIEGNEFSVKIPPQLTRFSMMFRSTCNTCGPVAVTKMYWVTALPASVPMRQ